MNVEQCSFVRKILKQIPIFSRLNENEQQTLAQTMISTPKLYKKGKIVVKYNERMPFFGIIWKGKLEFIGNNQTLNCGDFLGQKVLINDGEYNAECTIHCISDTQIFAISHNEFSVCLLFHFYFLFFFFFF